MIKTASSRSPYLNVYTNNGDLNYISPGAQAGQVRFNTNLMVLEVFDGVTWRNASGHLEVGLSVSGEEVFNWAREKMRQELDYKELAKDHPAMEAALDAVRKAEEQLKLIAILCKEENENQKMV